MEIWPFEVIQDGGGRRHLGGRHLEFVRIENSAIRSAVPENPILEQNMKWIGSPVAEIRPFAYVGGIWNPILGGRRGRRGSAMAPLERVKKMVVSYRHSIVTVALSVTFGHNLRSNVFDAQINRGVGHFGPKFRGVPLGADPSCWGCKERTSQAN